MSLCARCGGCDFRCAGQVWWGGAARSCARADMRNVKRCVHRLRLLMYGCSEVRCCARVVVMMSSEEVRCAVVSGGDAPGPRLEGRKEGTPAFPAHVPHAKPGAGVHSSSLDADRQKLTLTLTLTTTKTRLDTPASHDRLHLRTWHRLHSRVAHGYDSEKLIMATHPASYIYTHSCALLSGPLHSIPNTIKLYNPPIQVRDQ